MNQAGDAFEVEIPSVSATFRYSVRAANAVTGPHVVTVLRMPRVTRIDLSYAYPSFTGLAGRTERDGGDIHAPAGTRVRVRVHTDKPIERSTLALADGREIVLAPVAPDSAETELTVDADGAYRVALLDTDGVGNPGDTEYFIRTLEDRPPGRADRPAGSRPSGDAARRSDHRRAGGRRLRHRAFDLVYAVRGGTEQVVPFRRAASAGPVAGAHTLSLEDLQVQPGDFISYYARATDIGRGKRSTEARSDIFFLEVKPFDAEFASAQSQAMGRRRR